MSKKVKAMLMEEIKQQLDGCSDVLVVDASRVDAVTANKWRLDLRKKEIHALTVKNTLARRALQEQGVDGVDDLFEGPTTLIWGGEDVVALSKEIAKWSKEIEALTIRGAAIEGKALDAEEVDKLSKSPGRIELLGQIVTLMLSPGARVAGALLGPARTIAGQALAISEKEEEA